MRRIGLRQTGSIGLYGIISAVALAAASPMAAAEQPQAAPAAPVDISVPAMPGAGDGDASAAAPAAASGATEAPGAVAAPVDPMPVPGAGPADVSTAADETPKATDTETPKAAEAPPGGVRSGGSPQRQMQTRYSKRQRGSVGAAGGTPSGDAELRDVVCTAGCGGVPGSIVHKGASNPAAQPAVADDDDDDETPKAKTAGKKPGAVEVTCVAGCDKGSITFASVPNATEGGYAVTSTKAPAGGSQPVSGDWMVKINRERGR
jgi:hypothetical protein